MLHQLCRDSRRARVCAEACHAIAAEHGFSFWLAGASVMSGWARASAGDIDGIMQLRQGLRDWDATGSVTYRTYYMGLLAEVLGAHGEIDEAGRVLDAAITLVQKTGEGLYEAELHRLRGELVLRGQAKPDNAEGESARVHFHRALDVARSKASKSLELRAALSLARLARG